MCGIAGICNLKEPVPVNLNTLKDMAGVLRHRGPDGFGFYVDDWAGLGHTRLSIIDLAGGAQPIANEDQTLWIVYNGEVFNYPELRKDLVLRGHRFRTSTDTEVILHLFEEKGPACLEDLNGQFALAIWNSAKKELFLARDRFGILPLHYTIHKERIIFASEIKAIFMPEEIERLIDPVAMDQIFTFWTTLPGRSFFMGIHELPPGHFMMVSKGKVHVQEYWSLPFHFNEEQSDLSLEEGVLKLNDLITDAVKIRLRADVPVGCYLSGGLDSSGITTLVRKKFNNRLKTFGIGFEEAPFDESPYRREMISFLQTDHVEVQARNEQIGASFRNTLWHCEKPILRTAPVPLFLLSEGVRRSGFKVVLTGEGADEVFGGYNIFKEAKVRRFLARQPDSEFRSLLLLRLYPYIFRGNQRGKRFVQSFFRTGLDKVDDPCFSHLLRWQNTGKIKTFFSERLKAEVGDYSSQEDLKESLPESFGKWDFLSRAQYLEIVTFLSTYLLSSQGDRVAMAHSVEIRPPFLDHRIMEFMGQIPARWKIRGLTEKYILKKVFQEILPDKIVSRPKHPYRAPIRESLLYPESDYAQNYLSEDCLKETKFFDPPKVKKLLHKIKAAGQASEVENMALAGVLSSQIVHDQFIAHFPSKEVVPISPDVIIDRRTIFPG